MNIQDIILSNWTEFINANEIKVLIIPSCRCDCGLDIIYDIIHEYSGNILAGMMYPDVDPITGKPSKIIDLIDIDNMEQIMEESPSLIVFNKDIFVEAYTNLRDEDDETGETLRSNIINILNNLSNKND